MGAESDHHNSHPGNHTNQHTGDHAKAPTTTQPAKLPTPAAPLRAAPAATAAAAAAAAPHAAAAIASKTPAATTALPGAAAKVAAAHAAAAAAASTGLHPSVIAALAGILLGMIACIGTCIVCRIYRRTRYYKKVQHSLEEEERAFQASLSLKYGEGGEPARSKCLVGSVRGRLPRLLRPRLAALGSPALPGRRRPTAHWRSQPLPRVLEPAGSKAADSRPRLTIQVGLERRGQEACADGEPESRAAGASARRRA